MRSPATPSGSWLTAITSSAFRMARLLGRMLRWQFVQEVCGRRWHVRCKLGKLGDRDGDSSVHLHYSTLQPAVQLP